ncbi:hypothetical protein [Tepidiphilus succinatimandens]|jgi:hypothetical protein|uniref:hypothetical protein n=1 Tax=Tepidiphilus succinatimandens TaxID=224436 RepID=UPI00112F44E3|nr:hypothetical protein [Tepidiphilus succinatimandens]
MISLMEAKSTGLDDAVKKLLSGWTIRSLEQPFYRGGASYRHAIVSDSDARVVSDLVWRHLSRWIEINGQRAIVKRTNGSYLVRGKSGMTAGHLWRSGNCWVLQMTETQPETFGSLKAAQVAALEASLRY